MGSGAVYEQFKKHRAGVVHLRQKSSYKRCSIYAVGTFWNREAILLEVSFYWFIWVNYSELIKSLYFLPYRILLHFQLGNLLASLDWTDGSSQGQLSTKILFLPIICRKRMHHFSLQTLFGCYSSWLFNMCWGWNIQDSNFYCRKGRRHIFKWSYFWAKCLNLWSLLQNFSALRKIKVHQDTEGSWEAQFGLVSPGLIRQMYFPSVYFSSKPHFYFLYPEGDDLRQQHPLSERKEEKFSSLHRLTRTCWTFTWHFCHQQRAHK